MSKEIETIYETNRAWVILILALLAGCLLIAHQPHTVSLTNGPDNTSIEGTP